MLSSFYRGGGGGGEELILLIYCVKSLITLQSLRRYTAE
uniref:Uncharacterized protein n=1 Tax=Lepeophtheirus salmonis TaxID=72036 RepID=A0A0K2VJR2_LEPSM